MRWYWNEMLSFYRFPSVQSHILTMEGQDYGSFYCSLFTTFKRQMTFDNRYHSKRKKKKEAAWLRWIKGVGSYYMKWPCMCVVGSIERWVCGRRCQYHGAHAFERDCYYWAFFSLSSSFYYNTHCTWDLFKVLDLYSARTQVPLLDDGLYAEPMIGLVLIG